MTTRVIRQSERMSTDESDHPPGIEEVVHEQLVKTVAQRAAILIDELNTTDLSRGRTAVDGDEYGVVSDVDDLRDGRDKGVDIIFCGQLRSEPLERSGTRGPNRSSPPSAPLAVELACSVVTARSSKRARRSASRSVWLGSLTPRSLA